MQLRHRRTRPVGQDDQQERRRPAHWIVEVVRPSRVEQQAIAWLQVVLLLVNLVDEFTNEAVNKLLTFVADRLSQPARARRHCHQERLELLVGQALP